MFFYLLLSFLVHFRIIFGYSIYSDVIPPLMDVQPCDAVFGVVFSDFKPPFLGSGDSRGQIKHWHGVTSFLTEGLAPHPRSRKATRRLCAHVANRAPPAQWMCGGTQC